MDISKEREHAVGVLAVHAMMHMRKDNWSQFTSTDERFKTALNKCTHDISVALTQIIHLALEESMDVESSKGLMDQLKKRMDDERGQLVR